MKKQLLTLLLMLSTTSLWAIEKDTEGYYLLGSADDWKEFATLVQSENVVNAKMIADIDLGEEVVMVGSSQHHYGGTFDGQGHTLTIKFDARDWDMDNHAYLGIAPFFDTENATIRNLHTTGSIVVNQVGASGLIGWTYGINTIENCWSSVELKGIGTKTDTYAGFVFRQDGTWLNIKDCYFSGSFQSIRKVAHGGFVGHQVRGGTTITNSLIIFGEDTDIPAGDCYTFVRNVWYEQTGITINNSYYLRPLGVIQGTATTEEELSNGTTATNLQNNREEIVWVQKDGLPMLKIFAEGSTDIESIYKQASTNKIMQCYSLHGNILSTPQKGINIVRMNDGTTRKIMVR